MPDKKNKQSNEKKVEHRNNKKVNKKHGSAESTRATFNAIDKD